MVLSLTQAPDLAGLESAVVVVEPVDWLESAKRCRGLPHPNCWQGPYQQKRVGHLQPNRQRARFEGSTYLAHTFNRVLEVEIVTRISSQFTAIA